MENREIYSFRILNSSVEMAYQAFENPNYLKNWWGPKGFTNTIHEFDLKPGGNWKLTMHGPDKGNYENYSVFETVIPNELVRWKRKSQPLFDMEIEFIKIDNNKTKISFKMIFENADECSRIRKIVEPKNEENFDRLVSVIQNMRTNL